jgi:RNA polymerase sigma-70 factor (ECF subfamily)
MQETSLSLLKQLQEAPNAATWQQLYDIYEPLIARWLARSPLQAADREDLKQEVLQTIVQKLPTFQRLREGSFRAWLRVVTVNRVREFWRARKHLPVATGDSDFLEKLQELADPESELAQRWEAEHDRHVAHRLLELLAPQFEPHIILAFQKVVQEGKKPAAVAAELGMGVAAVYAATSRILRRLREVTEGLLS